MYYIIFVVCINLLIVEGNDQTCGAVPMTQWAGVDLQRVENLPRPVNLVVIQHTASKECNTDEECAKVIRGIRNYHTKDLKFTDIGQSFLIGGNGKVYEGAGWFHVGAHTFKYNDRSIGISFIGDFRDKLPNKDALKVAQDLIAFGVEHHHLTDDYYLVGHQQLSKTVSPGATLQDEIQNWPHWLQDVKKL